MHWIYSVPLFPLGILIPLVFVTVGLAGMWLTHRHVRARLDIRQHHSEFTAVIIEGILIIYGLAIALILVSVWENHAEASTLVSNEATAIAMLYRDSGAYPEPTRAPPSRGTARLHRVSRQGSLAGAATGRATDQGYGVDEPRFRTSSSNSSRSPNRRRSCMPRRFTRSTT